MVADDASRVEGARELAGEHVVARAVADGARAVDAGELASGICIARAVAHDARATIVARSGKRPLGDVETGAQSVARIGADRKHAAELAAERARAAAIA